MVLHIAQGSYGGTIMWEKSKKSSVSSYCVVSKLGEITQVVDLDDKAWTQAAGNREWIGIEFEGNVPDALTPQQVAAAAHLLAFLNTQYGVPIAITDDPVNGRGLAYHSLGGSAWSPAGHNCPGPNIVAQRPDIVAAAQKLVAQPEDDEVTEAQIEDIVDRVTKRMYTVNKDGTHAGALPDAIKAYIPAIAKAVAAAIK